MRGMRVTKCLFLFGSARVHTSAIQNNETPKKLRKKLRDKLRLRSSVFWPLERAQKWTVY